MANKFDIDLDPKPHKLREFVVKKAIRNHGDKGYEFFVGEIISNRYFMCQGRYLFASTDRIETACTDGFIFNHPENFEEREYEPDIFDRRGLCVSSLPLKIELTNEKDLIKEDIVPNKKDFMLNVIITTAFKAIREKSCRSVTVERIERTCDKGIKFDAIVIKIERKIEPEDK